VNLSTYRRHFWRPHHADVFQCGGCDAFATGVKAGEDPRGYCGLPALRNFWKLGGSVSAVVKIDWLAGTFQLADGRTGKFGEGALV